MNLNDLPIYKNDCFEELTPYPESSGDKNEGVGNLKFVRRISFQLSNLCNYTMIHKKCPLSQCTEKIILPSKVVYSTIDEVSEFNYNGIFGFHIYNEPMMDPRLFLLISYVKKMCPKACALICTNGYMLNQQMMVELEEIGVDSLNVSAYSISEYNRLVELESKISYQVMPMQLDDRESLYDRIPLNLKKSCHAPLNEVCIAPTGDIILCCLDWKNKHTFGNLINHDFLSLINGKEITDVFQELSAGCRSLDLCRCCDWSR